MINSRKDETNDLIDIDRSMLAGQGKRFANFIVDMIVKNVLVYFVYMVSWLLSLAEYDNMLVWYEQVNPFLEILYGYLMMFLYFVVMESATQRTLGKYITNTIVVMADGSKPPLITIMLRTLCRAIPFDGFSFLGSAARGWHDSLSKTYVVDAAKYKAALHLKNSFNEIGSNEL